MIPMMLKEIIPCASLCFLLCCCASADLTIVGGTRGQREAIQWVYADRIPLQFHTSQSIAVQILNDTDMDSFLNDSNGQPVSNDNSDDSVDGVYEDGPPVITLRASRPDDELEYTASHEYGHYVWRTRLNGQQKRAYNRIYAIQKSLGNLISDYAGYSVDEGFAEAFATYANQSEGSAVISVPMYTPKAAKSARPDTNRPYTTTSKAAFQINDNSESVSCR